MIASKGLSERELSFKLKNLGYKKLRNRETVTGNPWKNKDGKVILVPDPIQGFYPDWLLKRIDF